MIGKVIEKYYAHTITISNARSLVSGYFVTLYRNTRNLVDRVSIYDLACQSPLLADDVSMLN